MIKVVLDTNIVVSANLSFAGLEALVLRLALSRSIQMYTSAAILTEYENVLRRPKFKFPKQQLETVLQLIGQAGIRLADLPTVAASKDETDNRFLECAEAASAGFLITGNIKHFPATWKNTQIVTSKQLLDQIGASLLHSTP